MILTEQEDRETVVFNRMMSYFIDHHAPRDPLRRANFAADIASLMRQATLHQAEIYERVIRAALGPIMPLTQMFPPPVKAQSTDPQPKEKPDGVNAAPAQKPNP